MAKKQTANIEPDLTKRSCERKYRLGTRYITATGGMYQYGKVDFGVCGYDIATSKSTKRIQYMWVLMKP